MNCKCDEEMAFTLTELFAGGNFDDQFLTLADGSGFDHADQCRAAVQNLDNGSSDSEDPIGGNGNGGNGGNNNGVSIVEELQCCGTYPSRFGFFSHGGSRSCCGEVTYNTNKHDCCAGGFLQAIGTCPDFEDSEDSCLIHNNCTDISH